MADDSRGAEAAPGTPIVNDVLALPETSLRLTHELWAWLTDESYVALVAIGGALLAYLALELAFRAARRLLRRGTPGSYLQLFARVAERTMSVFLLLLALRAMGAIVAPPPLWERAIGFLFTIAMVVQVARWSIALLVGFIDLRRDAEGGFEPEVDSAVGIFRVFIQVAVWIIAGIALLDNLGVNVTALIAGLGIGGIAIGLAAQGIFSDLFAALAIILDKPFRKGDFISISGPQGTSGTVEHIGLKSTRIRALSGELVSVANAQLLNQQIANFAAVPRRRAVVAIEIAYQTPIELLERLPAELQAIVEGRPACRFDRAMLVRFAPSGLDYELIFFVEEPGLAELLAEQQAVMLEIIRRFRALGIEFAFPAQTTYLAGPDGHAVDLGALAMAAAAARAR